MNGCAPGLALIEWLKATRKWAIKRAWKAAGTLLSNGQRREHDKAFGILPEDHRNE